MPPSGYELGMGEFVLPSLGVFLIGWLLVVLVGWLIEQSYRHRERRRDTARDPHRKYIVRDAHLEKQLMK